MCASDVASLLAVLLTLPALPLPGVEELLHVSPLLLREGKARHEPACLTGIVVLDRCLEMLAHRRPLAELPPQPAEKAHLRRVHAGKSRTLGPESVETYRRAPALRITVLPISGGSHRLTPAR